MKIAYSHLIKNIVENPTIGEISDSLFQLGHEHEIEGDIFDIEFTPNRGDCLSVNGLLRDLAVFFTIDLKQELYKEKINKLPLDFKNLSVDICPEITFLRLEVDELPLEYEQSLNNYFVDLGINKSNFFTDVSNYLSYETGQPTHCYDANKIKGGLIFHELDKKIEFRTLLDKKITLDEKNAVFSLNNEVINLAGVVGGESTSCSSNTTSVLVECAYFTPEAIIGKSVKYDIKSDASHKFERGVNQMCHENVLRRFIAIINEHTNIRNLSMASFKAKECFEHKIPIDVKKINKIIGIDISKEEYLNHISKLGFCKKHNFIIVPPFRADIRTNNDLAEEVARVIGYDNIALKKLNIPNDQNIRSKDVENKLRYFLLDHGFYEVINSPFVGRKLKESIKVDNPLDSNREFLRTNIRDSLLENLLYNEKRQKDSVKLFEISDVYFSDNGVSKKRKLSIIASGRVGLNFEDFSKKINKKYLANLFQKIVPDEDLKFDVISRDSIDTKIKSEIISLEVNIDIFSNKILSYKEKSSPPKSFNQYKQISEHPSSFKDISYLIKDLSKTNDLVELLLNYNSNIIKQVFIFDYYKNEKIEEVKIGFRFVFQAKNTTLTSIEIEDIYSDIIRISLNIDGITVPGL